MYYYYYYSVKCCSTSSTLTFDVEISFKRKWSRFLQEQISRLISIIGEIYFPIKLGQDCQDKGVCDVRSCGGLSTKDVSS